MIERDITTRLSTDGGTYIQVLVGPRQCGKSTLFSYLGGETFQEITLDDLQLRQLATTNPRLLLEQYPQPLIIDEIQYAPELFPELKRIIDQLKKQRLKEGATKDIEVLFRLTGSNQILLDNKVKETLAGRASYYDLNTLSVHELTKHAPDLSLSTILFQGGWPEIYINPTLNPTNYLNDYIRTYLEKDIVLSANITKRREFHTILAMLAARTGTFLNYSNIAKDSGVKSVTIQDWVSILEQTKVISLLHPAEPNLNKRLLKMPKLYFIDTGLCARLQGWLECLPMMNSPQAGLLFETLVYSEILKCCQNFGKSWKISVWRTREGDEIDFLIDNQQGQILALDAKLAIHGAQAISLPPSLQKALPNLNYSIVVTMTGDKLWLSKNCLQLPIRMLTEHLLQEI